MRYLVLLLLAWPCLAWSQTQAVLNPEVTQASIATTICVAGYTRTVRPPVSYTNRLKRQLMAAQGIGWEHAAEYELDHRINLSIGGHPRAPQNLVLQPWDGSAGARSKDRLELRLQKKVCNGTLTLHAAQACIWKDWQACARKY